MEREKLKRVCSGCGHHCTVELLLRAQHPFDPDDFVEGCPECLSVDHFEIVCDEPGCRQVASCGFPTRNGYRNTCGEHFRAAEGKHGYLPD